MQTKTNALVKIHQRITMVNYSDGNTEPMTVTEEVKAGDHVFLVSGLGESREFKTLAPAEKRFFEMVGNLYCNGYIKQ